MSVAAGFVFWFTSSPAHRFTGSPVRPGANPGGESGPAPRIRPAGRFGTQDELAEIADKFIRGKGAIPAFKGLYNFPASVCTSINNEIVHGIPSKKRALEALVPEESAGRSVTAA